MIAVRLHIDKNPKLNKGCYLIPVLNWEKDKTVIRAWASTLEEKKRRVKYPNHKINYITLVKIPDSFPVYVGFDWSERVFADNLLFLPVSKWREYLTHIYNAERWMPEMVLGERLPQKYVKWTKNYRLWRRAVLS